jgi:predicted transcriptional regulator
VAASSTITLKLDAETKARISRLAIARGCNEHSIMRSAIERYVTREELREQFDQDALAAWADYQATGLHVTGEEMDAWFVRVIAGETDAEPPLPHT